MAGKRKATENPEYIRPDDRTLEQQVWQGDKGAGLREELTDYLNILPLNKANQKCNPTPQVYKTLNPSMAPCPYEAPTQEGRCCVGRTSADSPYQLTSSEQFIKVIGKALQFSRSGPVPTVPPRYRDVMEYARNRFNGDYFDKYCEIDYGEPWAADALRFLCLFYSIASVRAKDNPSAARRRNNIVKSDENWRCYTSSDIFSQFVEIVNTCSKRSWHSWKFQLDLLGSPPDSVFYFPILPAHSVDTRIDYDNPLYVKEGRYTTLDSFATMVLHPKFIFRTSAETTLEIDHLYFLVPTTPVPGRRYDSRHAATPLSHMGYFLGQVAKKLESDRLARDGSITFSFIVGAKIDQLSRREESRLFGSEVFYNAHQIPVDLEDLPPVNMLDHLRAGFGVPTQYTDKDSWKATGFFDTFKHAPNGNGLVYVTTKFEALPDAAFGKYKLTCFMNLNRFESVG